MLGSYQKCQPPLPLPQSRQWVGRCLPELVSVPLLPSICRAYCSDFHGDENASSDTGGLKGR